MLVFAGVTFSAADGTVQVSGTIEVSGALPETDAYVLIETVDGVLVDKVARTIGKGTSPWSAHIPEGTYTFGLMAPGAGIQTYYAGQATQEDADPVVVGPDGRANLDFDTIVSTGSSVSGIVVDALGAPVARAYVQLDGVDRYTYSADDGTFALVNLPTGSYVVSCLIDDVPVGELAAVIPEDGTALTDLTLTTTFVPTPTETPTTTEPTEPEPTDPETTETTAQPTDPETTETTAQPTDPETTETTAQPTDPENTETTSEPTDPQTPETSAPQTTPTTATPKPSLTSATPVISDTTPQVGQKLSVATGSWTSGTAFAYEWLRGTTVVGKTSTYTPTASDLGKTLSVKVTGTKSGFTSVTKTSAATKPVATGTLKTATPTISGTAKVGVKLTAKAGAWTSSTTLTYRWYASGKPISGATKSTFTPTATQLNKTLTVKVTGSRSGYTTVSKTSKATAKVKAGTLTSTPTPKISGTAKVGRTLTAKAGAWKPSGGKVTYQWYRGSSRISKATESTYKLVSADKGRTIKVKVTYEKSGYTTVSRTSKATAKIS